MSKATVIRHTLTVRLTHWLVAGSGLLLLFTGLMQLPMAKRYNLVKVPGLAWSENFEVTLLLHYVAAVVFTAVVFYHMVFHWRRQEFAIMPRPGDISESITTVKAMFGRAEEPAHDKFQAKQRLAYLAIGLTSLALILTGLVKSYKNTGPVVIDPFVLQGITMIHTALGMFFMALFFAHIGALLLKEHRPLVPSMFSGKLDRQYAEEHLKGWKID